MSDRIKGRAQVPEDLGYNRLDHVAVNLFPGYSRSRLQTWIQNGYLTVDGVHRRPKDKVAGGEWLELDAAMDVLDHHEPQEMDLDIVFEDEHLLVICKPAGLVTHPAPGHQDQTLLNGLLFHAPGLEHLPRAGIVHRLDMGTTGLLVVAKTLQSHSKLVDQLQKREITREYQAVVYGVLAQSGTVDRPVGRHPHHRTRMAIREDGKQARTHYSVLTGFRHTTHLSLLLESGRTHQIRVHMSHIGFPLIGDPLYGGTLRLPAGGSEELVQALKQFERPALHARRLALDHPATGERFSWTREIPMDMRDLLALLQANELD